MRADRAGAEQVTCLLTDIEGSTRLWSEHVGAMGTVLTRHLRILSDVVEAEGGEVHKDTGDGVLAVFPTVRAAVAAAVAGQRSLAAEDWGRVGELKVRMGLHTGTVERRAGDYRGAAVNRTARIMGLAHGGQVLASEAAFVLAREHPPEGVRFLDLGGHPLRGFTEPERLFQVAADGMPSRFPPLRTDDETVADLPRPLGPLVGREAELAAVAAMLDDPSCRLVTLVGPGGIGKSRLAVEVAHRRAHDYPDGASFVPLASVASSEEIETTLVRSLGLTVSSDLDPRSQLLDYLGARSLLLVLDNLEHLLDDAGLVADILERSSRSKVLVTSRERLLLRSEWVYELDGLRHDGQVGSPALELFAERARHADPSFELTEPEPVARVCRLVDGLPLGIELAAGWVPALTPEEIADELGRGLDVLAGTMRDVPARHRSMRATLDRSWDLLDDELKRVLRCLAVFRGGFSREAARDVAGAELTDLSDLIAKSLVRRVAPDRYDLHPLVRQYAAERLSESTAAHAVADRHARHYVAFLAGRKEDLEGHLQTEAESDVQGELENVRAALGWAVGRWPDEEAAEAVAALATFFNVHGWYEGVRELGRLADLARSAREEPGGSPAYLAARTWEACFSASLSWNEAADEIVDEVLPALRALDMRRELAVCLYARGLTRNLGGEREADVPALEESVSIARRIDEPVQLSLSLLLLGWSYYRADRLEDAAGCFDESLRIFEELDNPWGRAFTLTKLGLLADARGDHDQAMRHHREACEIFEKRGDRGGQGIALSRLSWTAWLLGEHEEASERGLESLELFEEIGHRWGTVVSRCRIGFAELGLGDVDSARGRFRQALDDALAFDLPRMTVYAVIGLGNVAAAEGRDEDAVVILASARSHPATPAQYGCYIDPVLDRIRGSLAEESFASAEKHGESLELESLPADLLKADAPG